MGIIKAIGDAVKGGFADQWLEVIEADNMGAGTVITRGVKVRQGQNVKGADNIVSNGSHIRVYDNQFMILVDSGKIVDYTAEAGDYIVNNSSAPSLFNGQFGDSLKDAFSRIKFGGENPQKQEVFFINTQEIKGIKFGTRNPVNYFDNFYNAELFIRAHGTYSIRIVNPIQFYAEAIPRNKGHVEIDEINEQYLSEFLEAFQAAINQLSADGERISFVTSKATALSKLMAECLDESWTQLRGMVVEKVGVASISYSEESQKLLNMRNEGAMLSDPTVREGYVQGAMARGMEAAGSNANGAMQGFMGMGMAMNSMGTMAGSTSQVNLAQMQMQQAQQAQQAQAAAAAAAAAPVAGAVAGAASAANANEWTCECGTTNTGKFCFNCGKQAPAPAPVANEWTCECGTTNTGKFCTECGKPAPAPKADGPWTCKCGTENTGKFCFNCGEPRP